MGYTTYWRTPKGLDQEAFNKYVSEVREMLKDADDICFEFNEPDTEPHIENDFIRFNGKDEDGHETFIIAPEPSDFIFCKTARKPYDRYVCACLILAKEYFGDAIKVTSDGDMGVEGEWKEGEDLVSSIGHVVPENYLG